MKIFARDEVWRLNGVCDPNGARFTGQAMAQEALDSASAEQLQDKE